MFERIAIIGAEGQLASDLVPLLGTAAVPLTRSQLDLTDAAGVRSALDAVRPDAVVNCAAYNLVDRAEEDTAAAFAVNAFGVQQLARYCGPAGIPLLHVSTDYVFGLDAARRTPYLETDLPGPVSAYGLSKLAGEGFVRAYCERSWVVRTCGLYGRRASQRKGNFVATMLRLGRERPELRLVADQRCTPTNTADLAGALVRLLETDAYGLYHATNAGDCSWCEFAEEVFRTAGLSPRVVPITGAEYGAAARRPDYSVLDCRKLADVTGVPMRPWKDALHEHLRCVLS